MKSKPGKENVSYSGFVIPSTGELFTDKPEWFDYETTISSIRSFLNAYPLSSGEKYYLVMDNEEISRELGVKTDSVRMKLTRARREVMRILNYV